MGEIDRNLECLLSIFGGLFGVSLVIIAAFITPGYSPLTYTISELAYYQYKMMFSIGLIVIGASMIPFFFKLERELVNLSERSRLAATGIAVFTSMCISWVGVVPDWTYYEEFFLFHMIVALIAFGGSTVYIVMYSRLMQKAITVPSYKGPPFKRYMSYYGYAILGIFIALVFCMNLFNACLIEWILFINVVLWNLITASFLLKYKFSGMPGLYYTKKQYPEMLKRFEESLELLKNVNMEDSAEAETLKKNIEMIKKSLEKNK